jgi:hypothetical protein
MTVMAEIEGFGSVANLNPINCILESRPSRTTAVSRQQTAVNDNFRASKNPPLRCAPCAPPQIVRESARRPPKIRHESNRKFELNPGKQQIQCGNDFCAPAC